MAMQAPQDRERSRAQKVPAPLCLILPAPPTSKTTLSQFCSTVDTLWGSDRVLRSLQYGLKALACSPELGEETRVLSATFSSAFSQARYVNRIYGIFDGTEGLLYDVPKGPVVERTCKLLVHGIGGVGYHILENTALIIMIIRRCDPNKIPAVREWLIRNGLWDRADDLDALAQWCWLVEALGKLVLAWRKYSELSRDLKQSRERGDGAEEERVLSERALVVLDMVKLVTDLYGAVHFGSMVNNRPGVCNPRLVGILGLIGSMAQFVVRYRKQA
eukprot:CAMPEP_0181290368 /NCGR_PEP_ID=MMETSP1101-20121128/1376_1 /TAXON_ID=46948 /ORGANISM="Rhodomonas abbreviata, Strain Caron Lab Isolate" /LENGTH=273 /DNA_ID=CAMNT_0023394647 /DNA_START=9 /DNA_END=830 /DNA_ORIENTATION=+